MTLNADIPCFDCWLRAEYLYDQDPEHRGQFERVSVFGITSLQGRALGFWVLVQSSGAVIARLPVSALVHSQDAPDLPLDHLELWDCFSYKPSVIEFAHLSGRRVETVLKDGIRYPGRCVFTVDWHGSPYAENAGDSGWKCAHLLELDNGCYALQPNNRILWADPATIPEPFPDPPPSYKVQTTEWSVEHHRKWATQDADRFFYGVSVDPAPVPGISVEPCPRSPSTPPSD